MNKVCSLVLVLLSLPAVAVQKELIKFEVDSKKENKPSYLLKSLIPLEGVIFSQKKFCCVYDTKLAKNNQLLSPQNNLPEKDLIPLHLLNAQGEKGAEDLSLSLQNESFNQTLRRLKESALPLNRVQGEEGQYVYRVSPGAFNNLTKIDFYFEEGNKESSLSVARYTKPGFFVSKSREKDVLSNPEITYELNEKDNEITIFSTESLLYLSLRFSGIQPLEQEKGNKYTLYFYDKKKMQRCLRTTGNNIKDLEAKKASDEKTLTQTKNLYRSLEARLKQVKEQGGINFKSLSYDEETGLYKHCIDITRVLEKREREKDLRLSHINIFDLFHTHETFEISGAKLRKESSKNRRINKKGNLSPQEDQKYQTPLKALRYLASYYYVEKEAEESLLQKALSIPSHLEAVPTPGNKTANLLYAFYGKGSFGLSEDQVIEKTLTALYHECVKNPYLDLSLEGIPYLLFDYARRHVYMDAPNDQYEELIKPSDSWETFKKDPKFRGRLEALLQDVGVYLFEASHPSDSSLWTLLSALHKKTITLYHPDHTWTETFFYENSQDSIVLAAYKQNEKLFYCALQENENSSSPDRNKKAKAKKPSSLNPMIIDLKHTPNLPQGLQALHTPSDQFSCLLYSFYGPDAFRLTGKDIRKQAAKDIKQALFAQSDEEHQQQYNLYYLLLRFASTMSMEGLLPIEQFLSRWDVYETKSPQEKKDLIENICHKIETGSEFLHVSLAVLLGKIHHKNVVSYSFNNPQAQGSPLYTDPAPQDTICLYHHPYSLDNSLSANHFSRLTGQAPSRKSAGSIITLSDASSEKGPKSVVSVLAESSLKSPPRPASEETLSLGGNAFDADPMDLEEEANPPLSPSKASHPSLQDAGIHHPLDEPHKKHPLKASTPTPKDNRSIIAETVGAHSIVDEKVSTIKNSSPAPKNLLKDKNSVAAASQDHHSVVPESVVGDNTSIVAETVASAPDNRSVAPESINSSAEKMDVDDAVSITPSVAPSLSSSLIPKRALDDNSSVVAETVASAPDNKSVVAESVREDLPPSKTLKTPRKIAELLQKMENRSFRENTPDLQNLQKNPSLLKEALFQDLKNILFYLEKVSRNNDEFSTLRTQIYSLSEPFLSSLSFDDLSQVIYKGTFFQVTPPENWTKALCAAISKKLPSFSIEQCHKIFYKFTSQTIPIPQELLRGLYAQVKNKLQAFDFSKEDPRELTALLNAKTFFNPSISSPYKDFNSWKQDVFDNLTQKIPTMSIDQCNKILFRLSEQNISIPQNTLKAFYAHAKMKFQTLDFSQEEDTREVTALLNPHTFFNPSVSSQCRDFASWKQDIFDSITQKIPTMSIDQCNRTLFQWIDQNIPITTNALEAFYEQVKMKLQNLDFSKERSAREITCLFNTQTFFHPSVSSRYKGFVSWKKDIFESLTQKIPTMSIEQSNRTLFQWVEKQISIPQNVLKAFYAHAKTKLQTLDFAQEESLPELISLLNTQTFFHPSVSSRYKGFTSWEKDIFDSLTQKLPAMNLSHYKVILYSYTLERKHSSQEYLLPFVTNDSSKIKPASLKTIVSYLYQLSFFNMSLLPSFNFQPFFEAIHEKLGSFETLEDNDKKQMLRRIFYTMVKLKMNTQSSWGFASKTLLPRFFTVTAPFLKGTKFSELQSIKKFLTFLNIRPDTHWQKAFQDALAQASQEDNQKPLERKHSFDKRSQSSQKSFENRSYSNRQDSSLSYSRDQGSSRGSFSSHNGRKRSSYEDRPSHDRHFSRDSSHNTPKRPRS